MPVRVRSLEDVEAKHFEGGQWSNEMCTVDRGPAAAVGGFPL